VLRRAWRLVPTLACVLAATACIGETTSVAPGAVAEQARSYPPLAGGEPALDQATVAAADPKSTATPFGAYVWDDPSARAISRARIIVGDRCMRRYGFSPVPGWQPEGAIPLVTWSRYGLWDRALAERGYYGPEVNGGNPYPVRYLGADATGVYFGTVKEFNGEPVPDGGCQGQEFALVMKAAGMSDVDPKYVGNLDQEALARATQDPRVVSLVDDWKGCMKNAGWDYADVRAPFGYWSTRRGNDKRQAVISEEEKRSARTDLECKRSTGLLGTWLGADIAYQKAIVEREGERLRAYKHVMDGLLANANKVIADG
jgi:hypothetical protein